MSAFPIPTTTLAVGTHTFGPFNYGTATSAQLTINRTGLNSLPATATLSIDVEVSSDGGATWGVIAGFATIGGVFAGKGGVTVTTQTLDVQNITPGAVARSVVAVGGSPVAVAGTLTLS